LAVEEENESACRAKALARSADQRTRWINSTRLTSFSLTADSEALTASFHPVGGIFGNFGKEAFM
jgi:hypothetical protein